MSLASEYQRQFAWRDWTTILAALPELKGQTVLDLGSGVGDLAAELVARGARVIGVEMNPELLQLARARDLPGAEFRPGDLRRLPELGVAVDGIWCSFTAAYFPDLSSHLTRWARPLRPGGWIAVTEIDDLFAHRPLPGGVQALFEAYIADALAANRYDFRMGRKLATHLERAGFAVTKRFSVADQEFAFQGPADPAVLDAWRDRFQRMRLLREFCASHFEHVVQAFLDSLASPDHRSEASVRCCIARKPQGPVQPSAS